MTAATWSSANAAVAVVRSGALKASLKVEPLTCVIGAELSNVSLGDAVHDDALFAEIRRAAAEAQGAVPARPAFHTR